MKIVGELRVQGDFTCSHCGKTSLGTINRIRVHYENVKKVSKAIEEEVKTTSHPVDWISYHDIGGETKYRCNTCK